MDAPLHQQYTAQYEVFTHQSAGVFSMWVVWVGEAPQKVQVSSPSAPDGVWAVNHGMVPYHETF